MNQAKENRPGQATGTASKQINTPSLPASVPVLTEAELQVAGAYVAVVQTAHGTHRRRVYFNLPSAQRAVDRAIEAGHEADVVLCRLIPASMAGDAQ